MRVHYDIENLPQFNKAVITIGTFDGVHLGHKKIIEKLIATAKDINGETIIITFHPHPRKIVSTNADNVWLINTLEEKLILLANLGIHHVVVVPFNQAFSNQSADAYIKDFLVKKFQPHTIIIGHDHRFGKGRSGDFLLLEKMSAELNYILEEIPKQMLDEIGISSTIIRQSILSGNVAKAEQLLGYQFFFSGQVVKGKQLGRTLGYPTANLFINEKEKIILGNGVYAVYAQVSEKSTIKNQQEFLTNYDQSKNDFIKGMMNIGLRPTVNGIERSIEVNLFDFDADIYEQDLTVIVKKFLRAEQKFGSLDLLVKQLAIDKIESLKYL